MKLLCIVPLCRHDYVDWGFVAFSVAGSGAFRSYTGIIAKQCCIKLKRIESDRGHKCSSPPLSPALFNVINADIHDDMQLPNDFYNTCISLNTTAHNLRNLFIL